MTIDELGTMVKQGFDAVDKRLETVDSRLDKLERGQDYLTAKVENLSYRYGQDALERRVSVLEEKVGIKPV